MTQYETALEIAADQVEKLSSPVTMGQMDHPQDFSWAPAANTRTNGGDDFFAVAMPVPLVDGNFRQE